jgi:hypothetical protein
MQEQVQRIVIDPSRAIPRGHLPSIVVANPCGRPRKVAVKIHAKEERRTHPLCLLSSSVEWRMEVGYRSSAVVARTEVCLEQKLRQNTPGVLLDSTCFGAEATTKHAWSCTRQAAPGATLNRANWHPNDHPLPLFTVYSYLLYSPFSRASTTLLMRVQREMLL